MKILIMQFSSSSCPYVLFNLMPLPTSKSSLQHLLSLPLTLRPVSLLLYYFKLSYLMLSICLCHLFLYAVISILLTVISFRSHMALNSIFAHITLLLMLNCSLKCCPVVDQGIVRFNWQPVSKSMVNLTWHVRSLGG